MRYLRDLLSRLQSFPQPSSPPPVAIAWGAVVSIEFCKCVVTLSKKLDIEPSWLMACMAFESARTFRPDIRNAAGSGAVGLIQFMPATAHSLGTTAEALAAMTAEQQLVYVKKYFEVYAGRMHSLSDVYMAILWPAGIGKAEDWVLWDAGTRPTTYRQNSGLDTNGDKQVTKGEAASRVAALLEEGLSPQNQRTLRHGIAAV